MWRRMNWIEISWSWRAILFVGRICFGFVDIIGDGLWWIVNIDAAWWNLCWRQMMLVCGVCDIILVDSVSILGWRHFLDGQWIILAWVVMSWLLIWVIIYLKIIY